MQFDQSSSVQPNPEKKIWKSVEKISKITFFKNLKILKTFLLPEKNMLFLLVLPIERLGFDQSSPVQTGKLGYQSTTVIRFIGASGVNP